MSPLRLFALLFVFCVLAIREAGRYSHGWIDNILFAVFIAVIVLILFKPKKG